MGIFDKIKSAIWGHDEPATPEIRTASITQPTFAPTAAQDNRSPAQAPVAAPKAGASQAATAASQASTTAAKPSIAQSTQAAPTASQNVDVEAILDNAVKANGQSLKWRTSIVDTMKALGLDSSLTSRKELADEFGYTGDKNDSATMNIWLQKALMKKLAEDGGKVPADLTE